MRIATFYKAIAIGLMTILLISCSANKQHPSAQSLIGNFQNHTADFNQLLQMFLQDQQLERIAPDFTRPANSVSSARLTEYRAFFSKLSLEAGIEGYGEKRQVFFIASTFGLSVSGSGKGYAYCIERPALIVDAIDTYRSPDGKSFTAFQHIEGNWYLYFDYED
jgi:hypothetical protein